MRGPLGVPGVYMRSSLQNSGWYRALFQLEVSSVWGTWVSPFLGSLNVGTVPRLWASLSVSDQCLPHRNMAQKLLHTGWGKSRFAVTGVEKDTIINK